MQEIPDDTRWYSLFLRKTELEIKKIFEVYRSMGVEPILLKGWASARCYPANKPRYFGDIDLAIPADDFDRCLEKNRSERLSTLNIDLHREFRHLDRSSWAELFERSQLVSIEDTDIRILCLEDHMRVICTHWLTDGGQYKERLWDVYYAVECRNDNFDWDLCLGNVSSVRANWVKTVLAITKKYLNLNVSRIPFAEELGTFPEWVDRCLKNEWSSNVRLRALNTCLNDPKALIKQIRKRFPPNPIQATIETESLFDERSRAPMQIRSILMRSGPSIRRLSVELRQRLWRKRQ